MTIKEQCEQCYNQIQAANDKLAQIRETCEHAETFEGNWSWRTGSYLPAIICSDCGGLIKFKPFNLPEVKTN